MGKKFSDKERILTSVIRELARTAILRPHLSTHSSAGWSDGALSHVHFANYRKPITGDLVMGTTGRIDNWKIAFYVELSDPANEVHVVRDIDTGQLCNYGNETFTPIVGLGYTDLLVGDERKVYEKVLKAFAAGDEYLYRFGGILVDGSKITITIREWHGGFGAESIPFSITMPWTKKTTIKEILTAMRAGGYGTKSFRPEAPQVEEK